MLYKVKGEFDQKGRSDGSILIGNELYTQQEMEQFKIPYAVTEPVDLPLMKTYISFGARFAIEK